MGNKTIKRRRGKRRTNKNLRRTKRNFRNKRIVQIGGNVFNITENIENYEFSGRFRNLNNITQVNIEKGVTQIGEGAFLGCTNLTSINIPDSVEYIGEGAFENCSNLQSIALPSNEKFKFIRSNMFKGCINLKNIYIPNNVKTIFNNAFEGVPMNNVEHVIAPARFNPFFKGAKNISEPSEISDYAMK